MKRPYSAGKLLNVSVNDFARAVGGTVVDRDDQHLLFGMLDRQQRAENVGDDFFLVVRSDENGDSRPIGRIDVNVGMSLKAKETVQREPIMANGVDAN